MDKFVKLTGVAAPLPVVNVDTDMIIPKDYLKTIKRTGLGTGLFAEARYNEDGSPNPDFVLNKPAYQNAKILVAGDNFGCGSSREHAPWALLDFRYPLRHFHQLRRHLLQQLLQERHPADQSQPGRPRQADGRRLARLQRHSDGRSGKPGDHRPGRRLAQVRISDEFKRHCLLNGLDDIGLTLEKAKAIDSFEKSNASARPWAA